MYHTEVSVMCYHLTRAKGVRVLYEIVKCDFSTLIWQTVGIQLMYTARTDTGILKSSFYFRDEENCIYYCIV